jgi:predicted nucleic acid-binding protein
VIADASALFWRATEGGADALTSDTLSRSQRVWPWISPSLAAFELGNVVHRKQRSRLVGDIAVRKAIFRAADLYAVRVQPTPDGLGEIADICESQGISFYDAAYLQLAQQLGKPVLTADKGMAAHARAMGLTAYHLPSDLEPLRNALLKVDAAGKP